MGLVSRAVIDPSEYIIAERNRHQFFQFIVHYSGIIVGIDVGLFLPIVQFLDEGTGFVFSAQYGLLQGLDDVRFFVFEFGFLGEDEGIRDVGIRRRKWCNILDLFGLGMSVGGVVFVEVDHSEIVDVIDHCFA